MELPEINIQRKTGIEEFYFNNKKLNFQLNEFWIWNQSNLIENRTRGILAEYIVKEALCIKDGLRIEWDSYDLMTNEGKKIEIKSASYIQSWKQEKYSNIQFGIAKTVGEPSNPEYDGIFKRWSDYYIFCLLGEKDQKIINPMNLNQWTFYILKTKTINKKLKNQKTIGLNSLLKLNPIECKFDELKTIII